MGVEEEDLQVVSIDVDVILENCPITIMLYVRWVLLREVAQAV